MFCEGTISHNFHLLLCVLLLTIMQYYAFIYNAYDLLKVPCVSAMYVISSKHVTALYVFVFSVACMPHVAWRMVLNGMLSEFKCSIWSFFFFFLNDDTFFFLELFSWRTLIGKVYLQIQDTWGVDLFAKTSCICFAFRLIYISEQMSSHIRSVLICAPRYCTLSQGEAQTLIE